jgi:hypothetical protein
MNWQEAANVASVVEAIATVIETLVVTVSVILIWQQLKHQTKLAKASNAQALVDIASPFNLLIVEDAGVAELWLKGPNEFQTFTEVQKIRYENAVIWNLMFHENVYLQNQNGLLDDYMYSAWDTDLKRFAKRQNIKQHWEKLWVAYHTDFRKHLDRIIE